MGQSMCHFSTCRFKKNKKTGNRHNGQWKYLITCQLYMMDRFQLTFSVLSSRTASTEYWGAPKQNARCRGGKFGARKQPVRRSFATSAGLQPPPEPLRCRVCSHGVVARREPRVRPELFHAEGLKRRCGFLAGSPLITSHVCGQRHDDARFLANAREPAAVLISKWLGRNHPCQVN